MQGTYTKESDVAKEKTNDYLSSSIRQGEDRIKKVASDLQNGVKKGEEQLKAVVSEVDKRLHENPWPIVGGIAAASLLLGFVLGTSKRR